ncbi:MAG: M20 family metallopeptidase [Chitinophagales bacterium]|nr:M20 family metallopeptidase [Chitinophagales bacterium]
MQKIKTLALQFKDDAVAMRRHLHAHPELSYQEYGTSEFVQQKLSEYKIPFSVLAETGVVGIIEGKNPNSYTVALRADMDALPIQEENEVPYISKVPGVMHACGHDVHTTCLLGAARILVQLRDEFEGTVKLIFQPGEEKNPGGASLMIKAGALKNPVPNAIFGLHTHPTLSVGTFSFREGKAMASADEIYITVKGKGGHAAAPHLTVDTILAASQIVTSLQQVISRRNDPLNPSVLSITAFNGGHTTNVIPSEVRLMGTFRAMDEEWRFHAHGLIREVCAGVAKSTGAEIAVNIDVGYPFLINNPALTALGRKKAEEFAGGENVFETELRLGAEDFAYYSQEIPACFYRLGTGSARLGDVRIGHTPTFDVDEESILHGMGMMAWLGASCRPNA